MTSKPAPTDEIVTVARYSTPVDAQMALGILEDAGIEAYLSGEEANSLLPPALGTRLEVYAKDFAAAQSLLNDVPKGASLADDGNDL